MDIAKIDQIIKKQQRASNINHSVWVSASAGAGKTTVLTNRLIRLLLNNIKPSKILCLTFTKNASAEMKNRINQKLSEWVLLSDEALKKNIEKLTGIKPSAKILQNARTLFAKILDSADELKILTIHSFCQQIMKKFPFEAGIIPNFEIADEHLEEEFLIEAKKDLLIRLNLELKIKEAIEKIAVQINQEDFTKLIKELLNNRDKLIYLKHFFRGENAIIEEIYKELKVDLNDNEEKIFNNFLNHQIDKREFEKIYSIAQEFGTKTEKPKFEILKLWINQPAKKRENFEEYKYFFLKKDDSKRVSLITKNPKNQYPQSEEILQFEQERVYQFIEKLKTLKTAELTKSLLIIGFEILNRYDSLKSQKGILDYNDLIIKTKDLLTNSDNSSWISYKLDAGIEHILIDEAQDTSPYQWSIINAIVNEFFSGKGQLDDTNRTIFVVGDEKQSIFSFQGANPKMFFEKHQCYKEQCENSNSLFETISLDYSFRSLSVILELVDKIFEPEEIKKSISLFTETQIIHKPIRLGLGKIELWPLVKKEEKIESEDFKWNLPFQNNIEISNIEKLTKIIAKKIKFWIKNKKIILDRKSGKKRLLKYSDIMILLRKRTNKFADYLIRSLNESNIPVAGIDRLKLTENIIIKDLMALANFILFPNDNLNLANIIKSPIIGLNENDLFILCSQNKKISLWESIKQNPKYSKTKKYLEEIIESSKILTPYELFFYILDIKDGRKKIVNRFTETANDLLNEFLNLLKNFEKNHNTSLNDFLNYLKISPVIIKRDMEKISNEVRIITVHGAKGLQAPIIFLPDTFHSNKSMENKNKIYWAKRNNFINNEDVELPFWSGETQNNNDYISLLKKNAQQEHFNEYLRLLYVALTRAENELYVCGWETEKVFQSNWYNLISQSIKGLGREKKFDFNDENFGYILGEEDEFNTKDFQEKTLSVHEKENKNITKILQNLVAFKNRKEPTKIINPSEFYNHQDRDSSPTEISQSMIQGEIIHKLLEILPQTNPQEREKVADYYLQNLFAKISPKIKEKIKKNTFKILEEFQELFTKESKAEVPIAGYINNQIVSGQIDRLIIKNEKIIIIDYKNSRKNFEKENQIPQEYKKQLELYKELIGQVYPDKEIECYILWTSFCRLSRVY